MEKSSDKEEGSDQANPFQLEPFAQQHFRQRRKTIFSPKKIPIREILVWQKGKITKALVKNVPNTDAIAIFKWILQYMGDKPLKEFNSEIEIAVRIIEKAIGNHDLRDEIYCQVSKQLTENPSEDSVLKGWDLLSFCVIYFPPSKELHEFLEYFFQESQKMDVEKIPGYAKYCLKKMAKTQIEGARGRVPSVEELEGLLGAPFRHEIFGSTLEDIMEIQQEFAPDEELPLVLTTLAKKVIQLNGHKTEGIFRIPGDSEQVSNLKIKVENDTYDWDDINDPHVPASLLKLWMRELQEPIISSELYDQAISFAKDEDCKGSVKLVKNASELQRKVMEYVIAYLRSIANPDFVEITKMSIQNLSMVFAPNFLRCPSPDPAVILDTQKYQQTFVKHLMESDKFKSRYEFNIN